MIYIDPRSGSGDLIPYFGTFPTALVQLDSGDAMGVGNGPNGDIVWGVEIKKLGDALTSMQDGRLVEQLGKMYEEYGMSLFLLESDHRRNNQTGRLQHRVSKKDENTGKSREFWTDARFGNRQPIMYSHFTSWLLALTVCTGTMYLHSTSREETAATIVSLASELEKPWDGHKSLKVFNEGQAPGFAVPSTSMLVARDLAKGMGWEKAAKAAAHFKTPKAMVNATATEWREVDGIDKVLSERLVKGANEPHVLRRRERRTK